MVFSDTTNEQGLVQDTLYLSGANSNSYPIKDLTRNINRAFDKAVDIIFKASGRWQWDDYNQSDLPSATTPLVDSQQDYELDVAHLRVERVEIKGEDGNWLRLQPFDKRDVKTSIEEFYENDGIPRYYDVSGNSLFLYPAPNYSQAGSLKVWFQRRGTYFTPTDTSKEAGFSSTFHRFLSLSAAYDFALKNNKSNRNQLKEDLFEMENKMAEFYALRQPDEHIRLTAIKRIYK